MWKEFRSIRGMMRGFFLTQASRVVLHSSGDCCQQFLIILGGLYSYAGKLEGRKHIVYYVYSYSLKLIQILKMISDSWYWWLSLGSLIVSKLRIRMKYFLSQLENHAIFPAFIVDPSSLADLFVNHSRKSLLIKEKPSNVVLEGELKTFCSSQKMRLRNKHYFLSIQL